LQSPLPHLRRLTVDNHRQNLAIQPQLFPVIPRRELARHGDAIDGLEWPPLEIREVLQREEHADVEPLRQVLHGDRDLVSTVRPDDVRPVLAEEKIDACRKGLRIRTCVQLS
jgi:hypothetical protein